METKPRKGAPPRPEDAAGLPGAALVVEPDPGEDALERDPKSARRHSPLPPLNLFRVFDLAARSGSFTAAADELCVTQSAVSQQIRQLEEFLEVRLFRRLPRRVELTREGTALATVTQQALTMLGRACDKLVDPAMPTVICVNAAPSLASRWLLPRLKRFMESNPRIKVTLLATNDPIDFDRQDIDVALRWGDGSWPGVRSELLGREPIFPVCAPSLLAQAGGLPGPQDLAQHTLLQVVNGNPWAEWLEAAGCAGMEFSDTLYFSDASLMLDAAVQGQGVCLTSYFLAEKDLLAGRLVRAVDLEIHIDEGFYVLTSPVFGDKPAVANFRQWIRAEAARAISDLKGE